MMREKDLLTPWTCTRVRAENTASKSTTALGMLAFVLALLLMMIAPCQLFGQSVGNLFGDVLDAQGLAVPGATVTAVSQERSFSRAVTTNESGLFSIPSLPNGTYILTVTMQGFERFQRKDIVVDADANVKVSCKLIVAGAPTTTVEVQGSATDVSDINFQTATIGALIPPNLVEDMPLQDRSIVGAAQTLPGVTDVNAPASVATDRGGPTYSTAGARKASNLFLFDGVMYNNLYRNTGLNYPPPEAIQEVSVLLNNYGAEYGRNTGSVFNVVTKSGTNNMHGALWDYVRNTALNADNWYDKFVTLPGNKVPKAQFDQNQFGGAIGGPIIKDKLFYFASYQGYRLSQTTTDNTPVTFTQQELDHGDLSDMWRALVYTPSNPSGTLYCDDVYAYRDPSNPTQVPKQNCADHWLKNPVSSSNVNAAGESAILPRQCVTDLQAIDNTATNPGYLPGAKLPESCISPVTRNLFTRGYLPVNPVANGNVTTTGNTPKTDDNGMLRIDYNMGKHTIFGAANIVNADDVTVSTKTAAVTSYGIIKDWARSKFFNGTDQWVINESLLNTFRAAYRNFTDYTYPIDNTTAADLGITMPVFGTPTVPVITVGSALALSDNSYTYGTAINKSLEFTDQVSWTKGKHTLQFGGTFLRLSYDNDTDNGTQGYFHFSTAGTGLALGDFLIGSMNGSNAVSFATSRLNQAGVNNNFFFYAKDDWRILSRLSLSLGVRYELPMPWVEPQDHWGTFAPGRQSTVFPNAPLGMLFPGDPGVPRGIVQTPKNEIMPRIGFSYDVLGNGKTALRGGFGMFYNATNANIVQNGNQPWQAQYSVNTIASLSNPLAATPGWGVADLSNPTFTGMQTMFYPQTNFKPSYSMSYNLGIQQQLPAKLTMEVNYVGNVGRHLMIVYQANPALYIPGASNANNTDQRRLYYGYGDNLTISSIGTSNYNSLQVIVMRRMSKGLTLTSSYTWGRSIDLNSAEFRGQLSESGRIPYVWDLRSERGPSDFNANQVLNVAWTYDLSRILKYKGNSLLSGAINGWSLGQTLSFNTGYPVNITAGSDISYSGTNDQRPILMGDWHLPGGRSEAEFVNEWFNTNEGVQVAEGGRAVPTDCTGLTPYVGVDGKTYMAAVCPGAVWEKPSPGTYGNVSRNSVLGPSQLKNNMYVRKSFRIREGVSLQFRCDAFGVFNSPIFGKPTGGFGTNFGRITSTKGERQLQLSVKLKF